MGVVNKYITDILEYDRSIELSTDNYSTIAKRLAALGEDVKENFTMENIPRDKELERIAGKYIKGIPFEIRRVRKFQFESLSYPGLTTLKDIRGIRMNPFKAYKYYINGIKKIEKDAKRMTAKRVGDTVVFSNYGNIEPRIWVTEPLVQILTEKEFAAVILHHILQWKQLRGLKSVIGRERVIFYFNLITFLPGVDFMLEIVLGIYSTLMLSKIMNTHDEKLIDYIRELGFHEEYALYLDKVNRKYPTNAGTLDRFLGPMNYYLSSLDHILFKLLSFGGRLGGADAITHIKRALGISKTSDLDDTIGKIEDKLGKDYLK